jgi:predicted nucleotidyltransferase component of viral defense system
MNEKKPKNIAASVRARLLNIARDTKRPFDTVLLQYMQERFLYRLAQSKYKKNFILKGALMFRAFGMPLTRPTKDIDFLGQATPLNDDRILAIIGELLSIECDDGVIFDIGSVSGKRIKEDADYEGLRVFVEAELDHATKRLQIDIGFGDVITNGPLEVEYPVILDQPVPHLMVYSRETAIAEKFEAIVRLGTLNSRMKDFYDIIFLAEIEGFDSNLLGEALVRTFTHRNTELQQAKSIFTQAFKQDKNLNEMWGAFLKRARIEPPMSFPDAIDQLQKVLAPVLEKKKET